MSAATVCWILGGGINPLLQLQMLGPMVQKGGLEPRGFSPARSKVPFATLTTKKISSSPPAKSSKTEQNPSAQTQQKGVIPFPKTGTAYLIWTLSPLGPYDFNYGGVSWP
jgi:hypothetical protein